MRLVFMGTPEFAVPSLEKLVKSQYQVVAVYTQPDRPSGRGREVVAPPVKKAALALGLPMIQTAALRRPQEIEQLRSLAPDVIVVAAFGQLLRPAVLAVPPFGCLNIHPSLLPRHRGPSPIAAAILAGDEQTGVTIMLLDAGMDTGPILAQTTVPITPQDTTFTLAAKLAHMGADLLLETLPVWVEKQITPRPQDERQATVSRLLSKEQGQIDWNLSAVEIWRQVRAFQPWPGSYTHWRGRMIKILEAIPVGSGREKQPGQVIPLKLSVGVGGGQSYHLVMGVQTGEGILGLCQIQMEGRRATSAVEFLRGQREIMGEVLS